MATLEEMLAELAKCPPPPTCPPPPPRSVCGEEKYVLNLQQWTSVEKHAEDPDSELEITLGPCEEALVDSVIHGSIRITARNVGNKLLTSEEAGPIWPYPDSVPVPEPDFGPLLGVGVALLIFLRIWGRKVRGL